MAILKFHQSFFCASCCSVTALPSGLGNAVSSLSMCVRIDASTMVHATALIQVWHSVIALRVLQVWYLNYYGLSAYFHVDGALSQ
jgi:hypothetical protein